MEHHKKIVEAYKQYYEANKNNIDENGWHSGVGFGPIMFKELFSWQTDADRPGAWRPGALFGFKAEKTKMD